MKKQLKYRHDVANPALAAGLHALRSSGAAGAHGDKRDRRARTRSASKARAIREQG